MDDRCRPKHCHMPNQRERSPTRSVTQLFAQNTFSKRDYAPRVTGALVSPVQTPINDVWNGKKPFNAEEVSLPSNSRILNTTLPSFLSFRARETEHTRTINRKESRAQFIKQLFHCRLYRDIAKRNDPSILTSVISSHYPTIRFDCLIVTRS